MCEWSAYIVNISAIPTCFKFWQVSVDSFFVCAFVSSIFWGEPQKTTDRKLKNKINSEIISRRRRPESRKKLDYFYLRASLTQLPSIGRFLWILCCALPMYSTACGYPRTWKSKIRNRVVFSARSWATVFSNANHFGVGRRLSKFTFSSKLWRKMQPSSAYRSLKF